MPKELILKYRKDFNNVFAHGVRCNSNYFSLIYVPATDLKFAFIVSKKNIKKSVRRNYSKRLMKEIVREYIKEHILQRLHIVIRSKYDLKELQNAIGFNLIKLDLYHCLSKIKLNNE